MDLRARANISWRIRSIMTSRNARFRVSLYYRSNTNASCMNIPDVNQTNWTYTARYNNLFSTFSEVRVARAENENS